MKSTECAEDSFSRWTLCIKLEILLRGEKAQSHESLGAGDGHLTDVTEGILLQTSKGLMREANANANELVSHWMILNGPMFGIVDVHNQGLDSAVVIASEIDGVGWQMHHFI